MGLLDRLNALIARMGPKQRKVAIRPPLPPIPRVRPLEPRPMPPGWEDAIDIGDLVRDNPRDMGDFNIESSEDNWTYTWDLMPTGDMSDEQIRTAISMIELELETANWEDIWEDMVEDFWDWYRENYGDE